MSLGGAGTRLSSQGHKVELVYTGTGKSHGLDDLRISFSPSGVLVYSVEHKWYFTKGKSQAFRKKSPDNVY